MTLSSAQRWRARSAQVHALVLGLLAAPALLAVAMNSRVVREFFGDGWSFLLQLIGLIVFLPLSFAYFCVILVLIGWRLAARLMGIETWAPMRRRVAHGVLALALFTASALVGLTPWLPDTPPRRSLTLMQGLGCIAAMHGCATGARDPHVKQRRACQAAGMASGLFAMAFVAGGVMANSRASRNDRA